MIPEVNLNRFKSQTALKCRSVYMAIYMDISLRQLSKQWQASNAHVQIISFLINANLKLVSAIFHQIFIFQQMIALQKL